MLDCVSNWSTAEICCSEVCLLISIVMQHMKKVLMQRPTSKRKENLVNLFFGNPQCHALLFFANVIYQISGEHNTLDVCCNCLCRSGHVPSFAVI